MIVLYGVALSPYYNKVKIALIEKGVNFEEVFTPPSREETFLAKSPMGKIPYVEINGYALAESTAILEWLEDAYPTAALLPPAPNARARSRELMQLIELYLVEPARPLTAHLVFGAPLEDAQRAQADEAIRRGVAAVSRIVRVNPWLAGEDFSYADIVAASFFPQLSQVTGQVLGENLLAALPALDDYLARLGQRPSVARTWADRDAALAAFMARRGAS
ncbi:glutathione S-transferase family protein [Crenobacter intestini]|uniref:Glutathione S-transferase family protein n=1 Tax=Crenobacter intestini TaxID=2563443 RepID=A0A4T0V356_9NEIS|nr:glutathione S-transferase family protein [Crenobacter intestini]TIC86044.1 glutathione S-transferase family protein [Crenobacter intestini]